MTNSTPDLVTCSIKQHIDLVAKVLTDMVPDIDAVVKKVVAAALLGRTIFWCWNGGSAADSQRLAAELIGRFKGERRAIASLALTTGSSVLTSLANDYSYEDVFSRQVEVLVKPGDVLFAISTSGNSANVLAAVNSTNGKDAITVGLLGRDGGRLKSACRHSLVVPSTDTARIQELHFMIGHVLCGAVAQPRGGSHDRLRLRRRIHRQQGLCWAG